MVPFLAGPTPPTEARSRFVEAAAAAVVVVGAGTIIVADGAGATLRPAGSSVQDAGEPDAVVVLTVPIVIECSDDGV
jgi:hypothetical protein